MSDAPQTPGPRRPRSAGKPARRPRPALTAKNSARANGSRAAAAHAGRPQPVTQEPPPAGRIAVGLSSSSVYPLSVSECFAVAADLGYDGVEVMVSGNLLSQDAAALANLSAHYGLPVLSIHAPTLLVMQRVWGRDPWTKVERSARMAADLGAGAVVVHPPFRWQAGYAAEFTAGVRRIAGEYGVKIAVENMFPWRAGIRELLVYLPGWDPVGQDYDDVTLDFSHAATAGSDALAMIRDLGPRLAHVHLADGSGSLKDEHLAPGRGNQPIAPALGLLAAGGWEGSVIAEVNTRGTSIARRDDILLQALAYARAALGQAAPSR